MAVSDTDTRSSDEYLATIDPYADEYVTNHFSPRAHSVGLSPDSVPTASPTEALQFIFHHYAFNRAGGEPYRDAALSALNTVETTDPERLWEAFESYCSERDMGLNKRVNKGALQGPARLTAEHGNLFAWIGRVTQENQSLSPAYSAISDIPGFGEKITRFILRDAVWLTDTEKTIPSDEAAHLHPVDVWTRRVAKLIDEQLWSATDAKISNRLAQLCDQTDYSHARVNQGAWFMGAKTANGDTAELVRLLHAAEEG